MPLVNLRRSVWPPRRDLLSALSRLTNPNNGGHPSDGQEGDSRLPAAYHDVTLVCSDGRVSWNAFLLAANSEFLRDVLSSAVADSCGDDSSPAVLIVPDVSSSTISTMLGCTVNYAVRRDVLSVNEQQVMNLLGFTSPKNGEARQSSDKPEALETPACAPPAAPASVPRPSPALPPVLPKVQIIHQEEEDDEMRGSSSSSTAAEVEPREQETRTTDQEGVGPVCASLASPSALSIISLGGVAKEKNVAESVSVLSVDVTFPDKTPKPPTDSGAPTTDRGRDDVNVDETSSDEHDDPQIEGHEPVASEDPRKRSLRRPRLPHNRFACPRASCGAVFKCRSQLEAHESGHSGRRTLPCPRDDCDRRFSHEAFLKAHLRYHDDRERECQCPHCGKSFRGTRVLGNHVRNYHDVVECPDCGEKVVRKDLKRHARSAHGKRQKEDEEEDGDDRRSYCRVCRRSFSTPNAMAAHKAARHPDVVEEAGKATEEDDDPRCEPCGKNFASTRHLDIHLREAHGQAVGEDCRVCGKRGLRDLAAHINNVHTAPANARAALKMARTPCGHPGCGKEFATAYAAEYHRRREHPDEGTAPVKRRQQCGVCGKSYLNLRRHQREAHAENRFECAACGCFFPVRTSLERHERHVHRGERHPCPYCEKRVLHLAGHLSAGHGLPSAQARQMEEQLTGRSAARTDLQWTVPSSSERKRKIAVSAKN